MTSTLRIALAAAALAAAAPAWSQTAAPQPAPQPAAPPAAQAEAPKTAPAAPREVEVARHGDWRVVCVPEGKPCVMLQDGFNAQGQKIMQVRIRKIPPQQTQAGTVEAAMQVAVPLGVLLPAGVRIQIDRDKPLVAGYTICDRGGCILQQPAPNRLIAAMKKGAKATFTIVAPPNREIPVDISLTGFTAAWNALEP
ncbi:invasion associated locus B family protein [Oceanicella actignis]|uniref:invasion associated locus B family protein n=1 Tax=Oceanicella actignis TaxID=1189325 RepID=UPI0011E62DC4|nr:invasion associated locus B family protein [Oceanicella actignis]TYO89628.1 invasion protein IalB [Oceanicella actignis]